MSNFETEHTVLDQALKISLNNFYNQYDREVPEQAKRFRIQTRYDKQDLERVGGRVENQRSVNTDRQFRRMRKKLNKNGGLW